MKQLDFSKGIIKESKQEPEVVNEFLGTLLVCSVLGIVGSTAVLNVFKSISSLRTELVKLHNDRMQAKSSKMKAKLEREQSKRQYYLTKAGFSEDEIKKIMSDDNGKDNDKERDNDIKELRGLLKKKEDDLSPRERKRLEELSDKVDSDDLSPKEQESLKTITGKSKDGENENKWPSTPEEQKEYDDWKKNLDNSKNKAYKSMMAYENAIKTLPDGTEKEKHLKNLETMTAVVAGSADAEQVKQLEKISKETLPPEAQKLVDQVENSANKISDEDLENWKKEKGISDAGVVKTTNTVAETDPALLNPPKEKSEEDIKKEIKDKYSQEGAEVPEELQDKDKKLDAAKVDALKGDELKAAAEKAGVKTTVEEPANDGGEIEPANDGGETEPAEPAKKEDDNKVPYYDTEGNETGMYVVKKEDGSYEMQNEKGEKQKGDVDEKDFEEMKKVRDEKTKKEEPKKDEPNKKEPKKDDEEEDDPTDGDERVDNDDDIEDLNYSDKDDLAKDPSTKYKQRTYKRGNKTFKTKSYYDKKGNSISKDDFMKMKQAYEERQAAKEKKGKKNNESFTSHPWSVTRLYEAKKPAPVMEAEKKTDMETICKKRLVYIKYVMDTTSNNVEKIKMERMYNAIYNCCFDSNGKARDLKNLYTYLNDTMIENKGKIPGLPTNEQVENIDEKLEAWRKTSPDKFDAYMTQLEKENLDKHGTKKTDKAKDLLSPENSEDNKGSIEDIRKLSSEFGFTNILGLEPSRKASQVDKDNKDEIEKQENDKDPRAKTKDGKDVKSDDVSDEQIDKIIGVK